MTKRAIFTKLDRRPAFKVLHEVADDRATGCWARCGTPIVRGQDRVRVRRQRCGGHLLFHPECFEKWNPWDD